MIIRVDAEAEGLLKEFCHIVLQSRGSSYGKCRRSSGD